MVVFPSSTMARTRLTWPVMAICTWLLLLTMVLLAAEAGPAKGAANAKSAAAATDVCNVFLYTFLSPLPLDVRNNNLKSLAFGPCTKPPTAAGPPLRESHSMVFHVGLKTNLRAARFFWYAVVN